MHMCRLVVCSFFVAVSDTPASCAVCCPHLPCTVATHPKITHRPMRTQYWHCPLFAAHHVGLFVPLLLAEALLALVPVCCCHMLFCCLLCMQQYLSLSLLGCSCSLLTGAL
jgi:hypothetical protein